MHVDYLAHSCFLLTHQGYRVLFDPYSPQTGYPKPRVYDPDLIVISHDHHDHNAVSEVSGRASVVRGVARRTYGPLMIGGSLGWHGEAADAEPVSLTLLEWASLRIAHFGDLGRALDDDQVEFFHKLDLLMMPCGGDYTLDGVQAAKLVGVLKPRVVVPMHYRTPFLNRVHFPALETADRFLMECSKFATLRADRSGQVELFELLAKESTDSTVVLNLQHQMA